jgi:hypothetical protein
MSMELYLCCHPNFSERSPSWEASTAASITEIPHIVSKTKVYFLVQEGSAPEPDKSNSYLVPNSAVTLHSLAAWNGKIYFYPLQVVKSLSLKYSSKNLAGSLEQWLILQLTLIN